MRVFPLVTVAAAAALVALPQAAVATTSPGRSTTINVRITDSGIKIQFGGEEARGVTATFKATNAGKKPHDFSLLGHRTPVLKPGAHATFTVTLVHRGIYPYSSTVDKGKAFHGSFVVY